MVAISVVMPTYNTEVAILKEAVESILNQTFADFEFIIIDDGSTNDAPAYLDALTDPRVRIIRNQTNIGITKSLNIGFRAAQGKYIARMDADDISFPQRFEKQYAFMESHLDVIVCGTDIERIGARSGKSQNRIDDMELYKCILPFYNPGPMHPTALFRNEILQEKHIQYNEELRYAQDYDMWATIVHHGRIVIMDDVLLQCRTHNNQVSITHNEAQMQCDEKIHKRLLIELMDSVSDEEVHMHSVYSTLWRYHDTMITPQINQWYDRLIKANDLRHIYDTKKFRLIIEQIKKELISRTYKVKKTAIGKVALNFRYLSFFSAVEFTLEICKMKIDGLIRNHRD